VTKQTIARLSGKLTGERGLLLAIIALAYRDMVHGKPGERQDAQRYFDSEAYVEHLELLGLPSDFRPQVGDYQLSTV